MERTFEQWMELVNADRLKAKLIEEHEEQKHYRYRQTHYSSFTDLITDDFNWTDSVDGNSFWFSIYNNNPSQYITEKWTPKEGEIIEVSDDSLYWSKRKFYDMCGTYYGCYSGKVTITPTIWLYARPIQKTYQFEGEQLTKEEILNKLNEPCH